MWGDDTNQSDPLGRTLGQGDPSGLGRWGRTDDPLQRTLPPSDPSGLGRWMGNTDTAKPDKPLPPANTGNSSTFAKQAGGALLRSAINTSAARSAAPARARTAGGKKSGNSDAGGALLVALLGIVFLLLGGWIIKRLFKRGQRTRLGPGAMLFFVGIGLYTVGSIWYGSSEAPAGMAVGVIGVLVVALSAIVGMITTVRGRRRKRAAQLRGGGSAPALATGYRPH